MLRRALIFVPVIVISGLLIGVLSNNGFSNEYYSPLEKPAFQPPGWAFGVAWTLLYAMMGIALAVVLDAPGRPRRRGAIALFAGQLGLNFAWSPAFFGLGMIDVGLLIIGAMIVLLTLTIIAFSRIRALAGALLLPYLAWLCLAAALNFETGRLNPGADKAPLGITGA
ncbi:MAG TPA: TspO/MBR family protein [Sphingomicrobium sp.]|nr:TspO/MBR family protein [Sphingomicrobium sp.]